MGEGQWGGVSSLEGAGGGDAAQPGHDPAGASIPRFQAKAAF